MTQTLTVLEVAALQAAGEPTAFGPITIGPVCSILGTGRLYTEFSDTRGVIGTVDGNADMLLKVDRPE